MNEQTMPDPVAELEDVAHQVCDSWVKEHRSSPATGLEREGEEYDDRAVSLVIRDGDNEIVAESDLWEFTGTYALVRLESTDRPDDHPVGEPTEPPGWAEWVHRPEPVDHHVEAVRCSHCGESFEFQFPGMPGARSRTEPWDRITHRADCPEASERDREIWGEREIADELASRPDPRIMALDCIWSEIDEWRELREEVSRHGIVEEAIRDRSRRFRRVLEERMDPNYPRCPECGGEIRRAGEYEVECRDCWDGLDEETYEQWLDQRRRIWGWRGHGDRGIEEGGSR